MRAGASGSSPIRSRWYCFRRSASEQPQKIVLSLVTGLNLSTRGSCLDHRPLRPKSFGTLSIPSMRLFFQRPLRLKSFGTLSIPFINSSVPSTFRSSGLHERCPVLCFVVELIAMCTFQCATTVCYDKFCYSLIIFTENNFELRPERNQNKFIHQNIHQNQ